MLPRNPTALRALILLSALAACNDGGPAAIPAPPAEPVELARLECTVMVSSGAMSCAHTPGTGGAQGIILGRQGEYVQLEATNHSYTPLDSTFTIDVTVQNLIPQALGTEDGTTIHLDSVRVFFHEEPYPSAGDLGATLTLGGSVRRTTILTANQAYYTYPQIIQENATSNPVEWLVKVPATVTTFRFSVFVQAAVQFPNGYVDVTPPADSVLEGGTVSLSHTVRTAVGAPTGNQAVTWGTSDAGIATVNASGLVTAVAPGTATITATQGSINGSATIAVCPSLSVGEAYVVADLNATPSLCLGQGQYTVIPVNTEETDTVPVGVTGAGIIAASGAPDPARLPVGPSLAMASRPRPDDAFEARLRSLERREVAGRRTAGGPGRMGPRLAITPGVPAVGALMDLNVETDNACSTFDTRTGRVMAVGTNVIVMADTMNPSGGLSAAQYAALADSFDAVIHPTVTAAFGTPSDRDGNGRVIAFYTRAVNELTPPGSGSFIGGFFFSRDLLSAGSCPTSNVGEMFYMLAADPSGTVNGNVRTVAFIQQVTLGTLAHEYEHLINASRRMLVNTPWNGLLEEAWLDEGLAHIAEELIFYQRSGTSPGMDLDATDIFPAAVQAAFFKYGEANFGRLRQWLLSPESEGPFESGAVSLASRGSSWAFLRYAADRRGGSQSAFWNALVNTGNTGLDNLQAELGTDPLPWYRDFSGAMYADNAFDPVSPPAEYQQPSWNFRDLYTNLDYLPGPPCSCAYELADRNPSNGVMMSFSFIPGGGTSYMRMGVPASAFAGVTVSSGGGAPPGTIRLVVIRRS